MEDAAQRHQPIKGTKLHFISPTAERRHVLCVGVGGDRTHAARPGGAGYVAAFASTHMLNKKNSHERAESRPECQSIECKQSESESGSERESESESESESVSENANAS